MTLLPHVALAFLPSCPLILSPGDLSPPSRQSKVHIHTPALPMCQEAASLKLCPLLHSSPPHSVCPFRASQPHPLSPTVTLSQWKASFKTSLTLEWCRNLTWDWVKKVCTMCVKVLTTFSLAMKFKGLDLGVSNMESHWAHSMTHFLCQSVF